ncbi:MAG TPA: sugar ABC transporter ATP-binding protein [Bryobacteraceae bacterium]|nr:sugar ABC transporter ATP-binding protein [Bryobacteraceae bacterium]
MPDPVLEVIDISKSFWGIQALRGVSLNVHAGEIHAVTGENGAGKSTLMKIVAGQERADTGRLHFRGRAIAMIHQELLPFPELSVAENIFMGQEPTRWLPGWVDKAARDRQAREVLAQLGVNIDPRRAMRELTVAEKQSVEIAKALARRADLLIMDEPTSALSEREAELLLRIIFDLKRRGVAILYISHRMPEIFRLADTITVMRDGRLVATRPAAELDADRLIPLMVGRALGPASRTPGAHGEIVLEARGLGRPPRFHDVSFSLRRGEVLGLAGLMGAGRTDIGAAIFGLAPATAGTILVHGRAVGVRSPAAAFAHGIAMVTEDRTEFGFVPDMSVKENVTLSSLGRFSLGPFIRRRVEARAADEQMIRFDVRAAGRGQPVKSLSGGNQQKVAIARALLADPEILILDEPTRGIDVGAKAEIHGLIAGLARAGKAILLISSEMEEVLALSDRVLVMREGCVAAELVPAATSPDEILRYAMPG